MKHLRSLLPVFVPVCFALGAMFVVALKLTTPAAAPPSAAELSSRAAELGWEQHAGFQETDGEGVLYLDRKRNPEASERSGAWQAGALFVVDRGKNGYRIAPGPDADAMSAELFTASRSR